MDTERPWAPDGWWEEPDGWWEEPVEHLVTYVIIGGQHAAAVRGGGGRRSGS